MQMHVDWFVRNSHTCRRPLIAWQAPFGDLIPLPMSQQMWDDISMNFVTGLPWSNRCNVILVVADRLKHLIIFRENTERSQLASLLIWYVWCWDRTPQMEVSDQEPQFVSELWNCVCEQLRFKRKLSTVYHPQTERQTEKINGVIE